MALGALSVDTACGIRLDRSQSLFDSSKDPNGTSASRQASFVGNHLHLIQMLDAVKLLYQ